MTPCMAFFSFIMGCANVPLNIFLIAGACWRKSCLIMPWLVITLLEHLIVGVPLIVFMGLISLYLAAQLHLYIQATILIGFIVTLFFLSLSSWVSAFYIISIYARYYEIFFKISEAKKIFRGFQSLRGFRGLENFPRFPKLRKLFDVSKACEFSDA